MVQTSNFFIFYIFIVFYDLNYTYMSWFSWKNILLISISFNFSKKWYFFLKSFSTRKIDPNRPIFQLNNPNTVSNKVKFLPSDFYFKSYWILSFLRLISYLLITFSKKIIFRFNCYWFSIKKKTFRLKLKYLYASAEAF